MASLNATACKRLTANLLAQGTDFPQAIGAPAGNLRQRGFSLLEVLVAFSILALCLGVLLRIFSGSGRLAGLADEQAHAIVLAQSVLASAGVDAPLRPGRTPLETDGTFAWDTDVTPFEDADAAPASPVNQPLAKLYRVEVTVKWGDDSALHAFHLTSLRLAADNERNGEAGGGRRGFNSR